MTIVGKTLAKLEQVQVGTPIRVTGAQIREVGDDNVAFIDAMGSLEVYLTFISLINNHQLNFTLLFKRKCRFWTPPLLLALGSRTFPKMTRKNSKPNFKTRFLHKNKTCHFKFPSAILFCFNPENIVSLSRFLL